VKGLSKTEILLASMILEQTSDHYGQHGANDFDLRFLSLEERKKLLKAMYEWNGDPENYDEENVNGTMDHFVMSYLAARLKALLSTDE